MLRRLLRDINEATQTPLSSERLHSTFDLWWPDLEAVTKTLQKRLATQAPTAQVTRSDRALLEDILASARSQERSMLRSERLLQRMHTRKADSSLKAADMYRQTIDALTMLIENCDVRDRFTDRLTTLRRNEVYRHVAKRQLEEEQKAKI